VSSCAGGRLRHRGSRGRPMTVQLQAAARRRAGAARGMAARERKRAAAARATLERAAPSERWRRGGLAWSRTGVAPGGRPARVKTWRWPAPSLRGGSGPRTHAARACAGAARQGRGERGSGSRRRRSSCASVQEPRARRRSRGPRAALFQWRARKEKLRSEGGGRAR
jgi:hypothetical protein